MEKKSLSCQNGSSSQTSNIGEAIAAFLANIEGYYGGKYNPIQRQTIASYLLGIRPSWFDSLYSEVLKVKLFGRALPLVEHFDEALSAVKCAPPFEPFVPLLDDGDCEGREEMADELAELIDILCRK